jgi:3-hydroxy-9,10-secoandrosta-1,3,5(10)-triene-9,17-dione monooxygenase
MADDFDDVELRPAAWSGLSGLARPGPHATAIPREKEIQMASRTPGSADSRPGLRSGTLIDRAREIVPALRSSAAETERLGMLADQAATVLRQAGFFSLTTPREFGGEEASLRDIVEACVELARGDGSSSWITAIFAGANFVAAMLGSQARQEIWGTEPEATVCGSTAPAGTGRACEGGLLVSGQWPFVSGIRHAQWVFGVLPVTGPGGDEIDLALAVLPISAVSVQRTWQMAGMQGTGSDSFTAEEVFVPGHRVLSLPRALAGGYAAEHAYAGTFSSFLAVSLLPAPVLGLARAALDHTLDTLARGKRVGYSFYDNAALSPSVQFNVAEAASLIDTATLHVFRAVDDIEEAAAGGHALELPARARIRMDIGTAVRRSREAVELLMNVNGASGFATANPLQRIWRDVGLSSRHAVASPDLNREIYARTLLNISEQVTAFI